MFRERYRMLHQKAAPGDALVAGTIDKALRQEKRRHRPAWKRGLCAAAAAAVCVVGGLPLAAASDTGYALMHAVAPSATQLFTPVRRSDEDQGIRMEVESAYIHGNTAEIYVSFQDLEGDRIDAATDLYDSYSINRPFSSAGGCIPQGYDAETGKARFLLLITEWENQRITGKKITFSVRELLTGKQHYKDIRIPADLSAVSAAGQTQTVNPVSGGGFFEEYAGDWDAPIAALIPGEPLEGFPVEGIDLTGIGYIGGLLHIQTAVKDPLSGDRHGFFYLVGSDGEPVRSAFSFGFTNRLDGASRVDYQNEVFDLPQSALGDYTLYGDFVSGGTLTRGNWRITFPLENARE